jgi:hypothetical protein
MNFEIPPRAADHAFSMDTGAVKRASLHVFYLRFRQASLPADPQRSGPGIGSFSPISGLPGIESFTKTSCISFGFSV